MKNNLISAIAGWKSAALLALVAMVAAVAFSGVLTNTQTADAQASSDTAVPGQTLTLTWSNSGANDVYYRISTDSSATGSFVANGGQTLRCPDDTVTCDLAITNTAATPAIDAGTVTLAVKIDEDSPVGELFVQRYQRSSGVASAIVELAVTVLPANPPVAIRAANLPAAAISKDVGTALTDGTLILVQVVDSGGNGLGNVPVQINTTRGGLTIEPTVAYVAADPGATPPTPKTAYRPANEVGTGTTCPDAAAGVAGNGACTLMTTGSGDSQSDGGGTATDTADDNSAPGLIAVRLKGNGGTGTAEVTFRHSVSGLSHSVEVVIHGAAASISSATADESTIGVGGETFIVVTVVDAGGNPVVGAQPAVENFNPIATAITPPEVPAGASAVRVDDNRNIDRDKFGVANDVPACGNDETTGDEATSLTPNRSAGTDTAGRCAIRITAPDAPGAANDATRGTHTVTIGLAATIPTVDVNIDVGGAPASIETDAPARVDALSSTSITVTVTDDEGVRVGAVPITITKVEGDGNVDPVPGGMTSDGRGTFTFLAPLSSGETVFLVRAGDPLKGQQIQEAVTVAVGAAAEEAPDAPAATWNNELVSGQNVVVWNGDDGADASAGSADGVTAIWSYNTGNGSWDGYFPEAADVPGGNTLTTLSSNQAYVVIVN